MGILHDELKVVHDLLGNWWNNPFTVATWNARSLTKERLECAKSLGHDVFTITEL